MALWSKQTGSDAILWQWKRTEPAAENVAKHNEHVSVGMTKFPGSFASPYEQQCGGDDDADDDDNDNYNDDDVVHWTH